MKALKDLAKMVMSQIELQHAFGRLDPLSGLPNRTQLSFRSPSTRASTSRQGNA